MTTSEVKAIIESPEFQAEFKLPVNLPQSTYDEMVKSLARYFTKVSADKITEFADKAKEIVEESLKTEQVLRPGETATVTEGGSPSVARGLLTEFLEDHGAVNIGETMNMDFFLRIAREVTSGFGTFLGQNWDEDRIDLFPALELKRVYQRLVPRGSEGDPAGPENGWDDPEGRWQAACEDAADEDAQAVFEETGRMVALKNSLVWAALGDGAGDYKDTLGNAWAPFAFNSGMDTNEVSRAEAEGLGLLDEGEEAEPARINFAELLDV